MNVEEKKHILDNLIDLNFFSDSAGTTADDMRIYTHNKLYSNRATLKKRYGRSQTQAPEENSINEDYQNLCRCYRIKEYTLNNIVRYWETTTFMVDNLKLTNVEFRKLAFQDFSVLESYPHLYNYLDNLSRESLIDYFYVLALYYARSHGFEGKIHDDKIQKLQKLLFDIFRNDIHEGMAASYFSDFYVKSKHRRGWCSLMTSGGDVLYLIVGELDMFAKAPKKWDPEYWLDSTNMHLYCFSEIERSNNLIHNGNYCVYIIDLKNNSCIGESDVLAIKVRWQVTESDFLWFDFNQLEALKKTYTNEISFAAGIEKKREVDSTIQRQFQWTTRSDEKYLPSVLTLVNKEHSLNDWIVAHNDEIGQICELVELKYLGFKPDHRYKVLGVTILEESFEYIIKVNNEILTRKLDKEKYLFLNDVRDLRDVTFVRSTETDELYALWNNGTKIAPFPDL